MKKYILSGVFLIAAVVVAFFVYRFDMLNDLLHRAENGHPPSYAQPLDSNPGKLSWGFAEAQSQDEMSGPMTAVTLTTEKDNQKYSLGTHSGTCFVIEGSAWELLPSEKSGVICWWAGGGTELGVFEENGKYVVKAGDIEEGSAESDGFRGNFKALLEL